MPLPRSAAKNVASSLPSAATRVHAAGGRTGCAMVVGEHDLDLGESREKK
jgi:hypothetical protein